MHTFAGITGVDATFIGTGTTSYICFNSTGTLVQLDTLPDRGEDIREYLMIGVVVHPDTVITSVSNSVNTTYVGLGATVAEFGQAVGRITSGNIYGPASTDMTLSKSSGMTFGVASNYKSNMKNPNYTMDAEINGVTFQYLYRDGSGDWIGVPGQTDINPGDYDDGSGTLNSMDNNDWSVQKIYYATGSGSTVIEYGQESYNNETNAIESIGIDNTEVSPTAAGLVFRGWLVVRGNCSDLSGSRARFLVANKFGDTSSVSGGVGLTTVSLQQAYENSSEPEVTTSSTLGAVTFKEGTGDATENVVEVKDNLGAMVARITGEGEIVSKTTDALKLVSGTTTDVRYDKILASMAILNMAYTSGDLVTVRYTGDNDVDTFYRDVLTYDVDGDLANVKHYYGTIDLTTESGLTALTYDVDKNLETATYTEV